jgi:hypothetical protein
MKESTARRCDFCGVPFPAEKTPYKPILGQDLQGKSRAFCCVGGAKAHGKVSRLPRTPDDPILSEQKSPFSDCAFKNPDPLPKSLPSMEPYQHLAEKAIEYGATRASLH